MRTKRIPASQQESVVQVVNRYTQVHETEDLRIERTEWFTAKMIETYDPTFRRNSLISFFLQRTTKLGTDEPATVQVRIFNGKYERILTVDQAKRYVKSNRDENNNPVPVDDLDEVRRQYGWMMNS